MGAAPVSTTSRVHQCCPKIADAQIQRASCYSTHGAHDSCNLSCSSSTQRARSLASYMELPPELAIAAHFHVDALIERQAQQIERLVDIAATLGRHLSALNLRLLPPCDSSLNYSNNPLIARAGLKLGS